MNFSDEKSRKNAPPAMVSGLAFVLLTKHREIKTKVGVCKRTHETPVKLDFFSDLRYFIPCLSQENNRHENDRSLGKPDLRHPPDRKYA
jgi:hypothetical protein